MNRTLFFLLFFVSIAVSCKDPEPKNINELVTRDVPKFIKALPSMSHDDMTTAFQHVNNALGYKVKKKPTVENSLEASLTIQKGNMKESELILLGHPGDSAHTFGITLMALPGPVNDTILHIVESLLKNYKREDRNNRPTWEVDGWLLQLDGKGIISFHQVGSNWIEEYLRQ